MSTVLVVPVERPSAALCSRRRDVPTLAEASVTAFRKDDLPADGLPTQASVTSAGIVARVDAAATSGRTRDGSKGHVGGPRCVRPWKS